MKQLNHQLIASSIMMTALLLGSCEKQNTKSEVTSNSSPAENLRIRTDQMFTLQKCDDLLIRLYGRNHNIILDKPKHVFKLTLQYVDPQNMVNIYKKKMPNNNGDDENDPNEIGDDTKKISHSAKSTKWDFDLELGKPTPENNKQKFPTALFKISLDPKTLKPFEFMPSPMTVKAGDENGFNMFCDLDVKRNYLTFKAIYYDNPNEAYTYGHYNLGIIAADQDGTHYMPVYFDPEVKNDG